MLHALGLSPTEERVYRTLLDRAPVSVSDLARRLDIEGQEVREALHALETKSLLSCSGENEVVPAPPEVGLAALVNHRQSELDEASRTIHRLVDQYRHGHHERPLDELIELRVGREAVAEGFQQLHSATREQMRVFVMPPYTVTYAENHMGRRLLAEGRRLRAVYHRDAIAQPGAPAEVQRFVAAGEEARISRVLPTKLAIADDSQALIPVHTDPEGIHTTCLLVHPCGLLDTLIAVFELIWSRARPFEVAESEIVETSSATRLSHSDQELLSMLLNGLTDRAAARELGVSERTVQRRVREVMTKVDAQNRLQLGWAMARQQEPLGPE
jgi:DNA-binding CsgD family transcriptional regulator/sugar-specific transcriptional regulator TrmB